MTLAHDMAGDGPAVVLLHSVCDRRMWNAQWPGLIDGAALLGLAGRAPLGRAARVW
jgi:hypothetical protein